MRVEYITPNVTVHEVAKDIAYLNIKGTKFMVFEGFREAMAYASGDESIQALEEFVSEEELDCFLEKKLA
jgi:hypothetical protein